MVFKRGNVWWYAFRFRGIRVRESSKSSNKGVCERLEREHRRRLELNQQGLEEIVKLVLFRKAADEFLEQQQVHWAKKTFELHKNSLAHLLPLFGKLTLNELTARKINEYQRKRLKDDPQPSNRTVNIEIALVRLVMRKAKLWAKIQDEVKMLKERSDVGRELSDDEVKRLLEACKASTSRGLYPAVLTSIHTGLRSQELRLLRWHQVDFVEGTITVGKSKTKGGEGRLVYLSGLALQTLKDWRSQFTDAQTTHCVFPSESYGLHGSKGQKGKGGVVKPYKTFPEKPIRSFNTAWKAAKKAAAVECRWHDLRHSAASRIAAGGATDQTLQALLGWMSPKMIEKYSHVRAEAKRRAVAVFDVGTIQ
jgi:integrase